MGEQRYVEAFVYERGKAPSTVIGGWASSLSVWPVGSLELAVLEGQAPPNQRLGANFFFTSHLVAEVLVGGRVVDEAERPVPRPMLFVRGENGEWRVRKPDELDLGRITDPYRGWR